MESILYIQGMHCGACATRIHDRLVKLSGVRSVTVDQLQHLVRIEHAKKVPIARLEKAIRRLGYSTSQTPFRAEHSTLHWWQWLLFGLGGLSVLLHVLMALGLTHSALGFVHGIIALAAIILSYRVYVRGFGSWRTGTMETLVAVGTLAAFLYSTYLLVIGAAMSHFASIAIILAVVQLGQYLEQRLQLRNGDAIAALLTKQPETARKKEGTTERDVPIAELEVGDIIRIRPGGMIPLDGIITVGSSRINESMLTGEPKPVKKTIHDTVFAGTMNTKGMFFMRVTHVQKDSTMHRIADLVGEAQRSRAPVQRITDRVSSVFVPIIFVISLSLVGIWYLLGDVGTGIIRAVTVLVVACPCAVGIAMPAAIAASLGTAAKQGILIRNATALQAASATQVVAFDKTGTLTEGKPQVVSLHTYRLSESVVLRYAAALEAASEHPFGEAIIAYAKGKRVSFGDVRKFVSTPGKGVEGYIEGRHVVVGSLAFFKSKEIGIYDVRERIPELAKQQLSPVLVAIDGKLAAIMGIGDALRKDAKKGVKQIRSLGLETVLLSGDHEAPVKAIARSVGIQTVQHDLSPGQKVDAVKKLKRKQRVAMVGDGVNDAAALAAAHVGISVGNASDVTKAFADILCLGSSIEGVGMAIERSKKTMRVIRQNLVWAFGYNIVAVPVAAGAFASIGGIVLSPAVASVGMAVSSLVVVLNSLRLRSMD